MAKSKLLRSLAVGLGALAAISTAALSAGYFPYFPVIGGASYCSSVSGTGTSTGTPSFPTGPGASFGQGAAGTAGQFGAVCNDAVPAGPTNLPGTAFIPGDTGLASGQQPQTVLIPAVLTGATTQDNAPLTGTSITVPQGISKLLLDPAGTIATLTVVLPVAAQLVDGQEMHISSTQTITALTITAGAGTTIVSTPITTLGATTAPAIFVYHSATAKWLSG